MSTRRLLAFSPGLPARDIQEGVEGGPQAAVEAARLLYPDRSFSVSIDPATVDTFVVATCGPTILVLGDAAAAQTPEGCGRFSYAYETTAMAPVYEIETSGRRRMVAMIPGRIEYELGDPLPFEHPFLNVDDGDEIDTDLLAAAAVRWMFGYVIDDPDPAAWVDAGRFHSLTSSPHDSHQ